MVVAVQAAEKMKFKHSITILPSSSTIAKVTALTWSPNGRKLAAVTIGRVVYLFDESGALKEKFATKPADPKAGQLRTNRTATLYTHVASSPVVSLACSPDGCTCLAGHLDGSIYRFSLDKTTGNFATKFADYGSVPTVLGWAKNVVLAAGSDSKVALYDFSGAIMQVFDFANEKGFNSVTSNSTRDIVILGCYNGFHIFQNSGLTDGWEDSGWHEVKNLYTVSAVSWKPDGSQVALGGLCGTVDLYDAFLKRQQYNDKFEFVFISKSQVILTQLSHYTRMLLQSQFGWEILRINIYMEQYLIAFTEETLLLGNLDNCKLSEIIWHASGHEKFLVDNPSVCLIHNNGELFLVEYGCNNILTTVQTDLFQEALISIRLDCKFSSGQRSEHGNNRLAYLLDLQTVQVKDIVSGSIIDTINHTSEIVWLQLNPRASHLLLCDNKRQLHLFELGNHECITLLNICNFVQWVPDTDIVVAQSHMTLHIWYSIQNIQHVTKFSLKGDLEGVRRVQGHTEVLVYEGLNTLAEKALQQKKLLCAQKSFASCGDISRALYLHKVYKQVQPALREMKDNDKGHPVMQIKLVALLQNWEDAEKRLLEQGHVEDAIKMYTDSYRWKEALSISQPRDFFTGEMLSRLYIQWLLKTRQIEEAGKEIASSGDIAAAVDVFLNSNLLGLAADYALKLPSNLCEGVLLERIADALTRSGMLVKLGEFMESLGDYEKAQHAYQKGHFFHHALKLAEKKFKGDVLKVEENWGDWLVSKNEMEASIAHYLEAGCFLKAIDSAITSHQWTKATQIADQQNNEVVKPIYARLAQYFAKIKQFEEAERLFISAKLPGEALSMYLKASKYEAAEKAASQLLSSDEARLIYLREAKEHEVSRRFKDAEKLYLQAGQHDFAINMYKAEGMFDNVIQIVAKFKKDGLHETHLYLAQELERKGMLRDAEHHYLEVHEWKSTVKMYTMSAMWEDALRIAKSWGGAPATKQVAYAWAISVNGNTGLQSLAKLGLIDEAIDYAVDVGAFGKAFQLCEAASTDKHQEVQVKFAKFLEGQGHFQESEDILIKMGKPMEAVNMYVQQEDWKAALRVADVFQPSAIADVQVLQAQALVESNELKKAETLFVQAKKPEFAIQMYKARNLWDDAIRVAQKFMPAGLSEIQNHFAAFLQSLLMRHKISFHQREVHCFWTEEHLPLTCVHI